MRMITINVALVQRYERDQWVRDWAAEGASAATRAEKPHCAPVSSAMAAVQSSKARPNGIFSLAETFDRATSQPDTL